MPYLIDTDWSIDHLNELPEAQELISTLLPTGASISIVTYMELYDGASRANDAQLALESLADFVAGIPVVPFDMAVARRCAALRQALRAINRRAQSRSLDVVIAATALTHGLTLVTRNVRDYADIPGLVIYTP